LKIIYDVFSCYYVTSGLKVTKATLGAIKDLNLRIIIGHLSRIWKQDTKNFGSSFLLFALTPNPGTQRLGEFETNSTNY